jgi:Xaa-Pro aminopeptidase
VTNRLNRLLQRLDGHQVDGLLLTCPRSLRYITGYSGSNGCALVATGQAVFITDFRYQAQAEEQVRGFQRRIAKEELFKELATLEWLGKKRRLGFESTHIAVEQMRQLGELLPAVELVPVKELVEAISIVKEAEEIEHIRQAVAIADAVFEEILSQMAPGMREVDLAAEIEYRMRRKGSERVAFDAIVVSGRRSALPHGEPGSFALRAGDLVTMDFGARVQGYCSDFTRTVVLGKATKKQREIYQVTLRAQRAAESAIGSAKSSRQVDAVAREIIAQAGYGEFFGHGLGHGLGLEVHEAPKLSPKSDAILEPGMVVTVEPGIYLPELGGVRIEDVVVVREDGCEVLTQATKELIEL